MKVMFLFIEVPNFSRDFAEELKPTYYTKLSPSEQSEYNISQINNRMNVWSCMIAARAYNIGIALILIAIITGGTGLFNIIQHVASGFLGIKP